MEAVEDGWVVVDMRILAIRAVGFSQAEVSTWPFTTINNR
jgi:hypothetical protein